jgi:hypothetical protein
MTELSAIMMSRRPSFLFLFAIGALGFASLPAVQAGPMGYPGYASNRGCANCADSKFQTPRLNQLQPLRHREDRKRYNAAPCCGEAVKPNPYLIKTVVVNRQRVPHYFTDANGNRSCRRVLTTTYKKIYSDGSCYVWTEQG